MGTRSLICVWYKGRFVIAQYTQFDGYPEGQGADILRFISVKGNIERLKAGLEHVKAISDQELNEIHRKVDEGLRARKNAGVTTSSMNMMMMTGGSGIDSLYPSLSRLAGAGILEIAAQATADKPVPVSLDLEFANDSLFCEWAYCIDLDTAVFEVFGGGSLKANSGSKRFEDVGGANDPVPTLIRSFSLDNLPENPDAFIELLGDVYDSGDEPQEEEEEMDLAKTVDEDAAQDDTVINPAG
ncbi:hypothetical protein CIRG_00619 [Coccidioides immitis RMSCC 2394]|uniref:Uncharacterized protein n=1 Tax=Coccidioides immitis RMSCC 2394 TaxID=404692 RepID=A0A0J7AT45_COCIT|nr:hypothetical protein CIRG_00619 [Coccidioides immitis RMSCC 2394]